LQTPKPFLSLQADSNKKHMNFPSKYRFPPADMPAAAGRGQFYPSVNLLKFGQL
jgi:hypothetical protein